MNSTQNPEQDVNLKLRVMRYMWDLGYLVKKNVLIMEPQASGKQYTDIDVLAVKVDEELNSSIVICDCKSGVQAKTRERMFWLSGVMDFFGASSGIFLRSRLYGGKYLELAKQLGIMPLSEEHLTSLERSYHIGNNSFGSFSPEHEKGEKAFSLLHDFSPRTSDYLKSYYWEDLPAKQIATLFSCSKEIQEIKEFEALAKNFLMVSALSSLALSIIRFIRNILMIPDSSKQDFIKIELLGGVLEHDERRELLKAFHSFMTKEIQERYKAKYPISSAQFMESLTPNYTKYLIDLVIRICGNPRYYIYLPRVFELLAYEVILGGRELKMEHIIHNTSYEDPTAIIKPAKDFLVFAERSEFIPSELVELLNTKIEALT